MDLHSQIWSSYLVRQEADSAASRSHREACAKHQRPMLELVIATPDQARVLIDTTTCDPAYGRLFYRNAEIDLVGLRHATGAHIPIVASDGRVEMGPLSMQQGLLALGRIAQLHSRLVLGAMEPREKRAAKPVST